MARKKPSRILLTLALGAALIGAYLLAWQWDYIPRDVISTGFVTIRDGRALEARKFYRTWLDTAHKAPAPGPSKREAAWEVKLPSGRWIDCRGDCLAAAEAALN